MADGKGVHAVRHFRRRRDDSGAAAVEFSILLIPFVVLCFGMISAAIMLNDKLSLTQGVREAARYGATYPTYDPTNPYLFLDAVRTTARADTTGQIGSSSSTFCVAIQPMAGGSAYHINDSDVTAQSGSCADHPTLPNGYLVVIGYKPSEIDLIVDQLHLTLSSKAVARYEATS